MKAAWRIQKQLQAELDAADPFDDDQEDDQ